MSARPLPVADAHTRPFWAGCTAGQLRYQRCARCGQVQLIPRSLCAGCQHTGLVWETSAGQGRILSHTTVHRAPTAAFRAEAPYVIVLVDMAEGFRLMVHLHGGAEPAPAIGQPVRIGFVEVEGVRLPIAHRIAHAMAQGQA